MKLLMTTDTVGGVWSYAIELAQALQSYRIEVVLASMGAPLSAAQWSMARAVPNLTVAESSYKLEWMDDPWPDVQAAGAWLLRLEQQHQPDLIHLNGYAHGCLPWSAPVLMVAHSCVLSWWQGVHATPPPPQWRRYRAAVRAGLQAADLVVAPTQAMLRALQQLYGPLPCSQVILNGRNPRQFTRARKQPLIMAAGRLWDAAKNVAALDAVAPQLDWPVYVAGSSEHPSGGTALHQHVHALGCLDAQSMASWLSRAAIYALPARYEPFGLSVLEAALSGCALVLGSIPSLRELWGNEAIFVDPNDHAQLQSALAALIADDVRRERLARQAYARAQHLTTCAMAANYVHAYRQLLGQAQPAPALNLRLPAAARQEVI